MVILENYNNLFYKDNTFSQSIQLNNYIGSTLLFTGNMLVFAPANGTSYTIQATNPASNLVYSIVDMGVNSDFVFTMKVRLSIIKLWIILEQVPT